MFVLSGGPLSSFLEAFTFGITSFPRPGVDGFGSESERERCFPEASVFCFPFPKGLVSPSELKNLTGLGEARRHKGKCSGFSATLKQKITFIYV